MERQRDANSVPGRPSHNGGQFYEQEMLRRTPKLGLSKGSLLHTPSGAIAALRRKTSEGLNRPCPFGDLIYNDDETNNRAIRGGLVVIGDKNLALPNYEFSALADGSGDGSWLLQIKVDEVEFNADDDDSFFTPGIVTATASPIWQAIDASGGPTNYTDNDPPTDPATADGVVYLPVGSLTVSGTSVLFYPTGCGGFTVEQCGGSYVITRETIDYDFVALETRLEQIETDIADLDSRLAALEGF